MTGEGKTTVALNLARAYSESGARTLLIEGDLRRPVLSERLSVAAEPGLADVLRGEATLESATRRVALDADSATAPRARLDILVAGAAASNPQGLLEGKQMSRLLAALGDRYDMLLRVRPLGVVANGVSRRAGYYPAREVAPVPG